MRAGVTRPTPRLYFAPRTDGVHDVSAAGLQRPAHRGEPLDRGSALAVAVVVLEQINSPGSERLRVCFLVVETAGQVFARRGACRRVDAELEPLGVHVVCERLDAAGEARRVGLQPPVSVALRGPPAVVDVE